MKSHKRLMNSLNAPQVPNGKGRRWREEHPVTSGLIPMVDYVPPKGTYHANGTRSVDTDFWQQQHIVRSNNIQSRDMAEFMRINGA